MVSSSSGLGYWVESLCELRFLQWLGEWNFFSQGHHMREYMVLTRNEIMQTRSRRPDEGTAESSAFRNFRSHVVCLGLHVSFGLMS